MYLSPILFFNILLSEDFLKSLVYSFNTMSGLDPVVKTKLYLPLRV